MDKQPTSPQSILKSPPRPLQLMFGKPVLGPYLHTAVPINISLSNATAFHNKS